MRAPVRWSRVIAGIAVIVFLAIPCLIGSIAAAFIGTGMLRQNALADGRAPGTLRFEAGRERYIVALSAKPDGIFDGLSRTERRQKFRVRDSDASETRCTIAPPGRLEREAARRSPDGQREHRQRVRHRRRVRREGRDDHRRLPVRPAPGPARHPHGGAAHGPRGQRGLRYLTWGLFLGVFVFAGLGTLLILWGTVWRAG